MKTRLAVLLLLALAPLGSHGEDSARGRLADGRAYRTDDEGNQLVDYIAELEVNAESLQRRVAGLEDEVAEKQRTIERLSRGDGLGAAANPPLLERTLGPDVGAASAHLRGAENQLDNSGAAAAEAARLQRELEAARSEHAAAIAAVRGECQTDREASVARIEGELTALKASYEQERSLRASDGARLADLTQHYNALRAKPVRDCDIEIAAALKGSAGTSAQREIALREEFGAERARQAVQLENALGQVEQLQGELTRARSEIDAAHAAAAASKTELVEAAAAAGEASDLRRALAAARTELGSTQEALAASTAKLAQAAGQYSAASAPPVVEGSPPPRMESVAAVRRDVPRDPASRARMAAVDSLRGSVMSELNQVRGLVATRDASFARTAQSGSQTLSLKPTKLMSSRRLTLGDIAEQIRGAQQVHDLTALRADIAEIRALAQEDIDILRRTSRG